MNKLQKIQRDLQEVKTMLTTEHAKLMYFGFVGDPDNLPKRTRSILEKQNVKLYKYLSRLPWKFNFYVDTTPLVEMDFEIILPKLPVEYRNLISKDSSAINLIYGTQSPLEAGFLLAPSPWILLHKLCHALFENPFSKTELYDRLEWRFVRMVETLYGNDIFRYGNDMFKGKFPRRYIGENGINLIYILFTFGSARRKVIDSLGEGFLDFLTQILVNGMKADMVYPLPKSIQLQGQDRPLLTDRSKAAKIREKFLKTHEKLLKKEMDDLVGKYVFI